MHKKPLKKMGLWLFLKEFFLHPASIGSAVPSSVLLAKTMAAQVPKNIPGYVIEIGPGTGVVTKMLLASGIAPEKLIAVERSTAFCRHLRKRFPQANIIHGNAVHLQRLLSEKAAHVSVIVSGLPLRSLPKKVAENIGKELEKVLQPKGLFIQFTYSWVKTYKSLPSSFQYAYSKKIWFNLPPARIDVFTHEPSQRDSTV